MNEVCDKCGNPLESNTGLCPCCDRKNAQGKRKKGGIAVLMVMILLCAVCVFLYSMGYLPNEHLFRPHAWQEATCTLPAGCKDCGKTKGTAPGHSAGEETVIEDIVNAQIRTEQACVSCGEVLATSSEQIGSFLGDNEFLMTADQFVERYITIFKDRSPEPDKVAYEASAIMKNSHSEEKNLMYQITYYGDAVACLYCYDQANELIPFDDRNTAHVWRFVLRAPIVNDDSVVIGLNLCDSLMAACDPVFSDDEREQYVSNWSVWFNETLSRDGGQIYQAKNNVLYREEIMPEADGNFFYFNAYATMNLGSIDQGALDYEQDAESETPQYSEDEAEAYLCGTWNAKYVVLYKDGGVFKRDLETDDNIIMIFHDDHNAELIIDKFSLDEEIKGGIADSWNGAPIQWYYMYDSGTTLYFLLQSPYMAASIPCQYATDSEYDGTIRVYIGDSLYLAFEKAN